MRTYAAIFGLLVVVAGTSTAQQYRTSLNEGQEYTLKLMDIAANIEVVAHNGNEMVINASELPEVPDKAKGLRPLMTGSAVDNTGIGLNLKIIDEVIALSGERTSASLTYQISIPPDVNLYIYSDDFDTGRSFSARGLSGEVEINIQEGDIRLTDITGPLMVKANSGNVTVEFSEVNQDSPMSLVCSRGDIDVTLPGTSEVTLKLKASSGEVFTDLDITEQEDSFHASFDRLIMKSPDNELAWSYSFDSSLVDNWQELSDARDLTGIYVHPDEKRITVMERNARKRNRVEPFFMPMEEYKRATDLYVDALGLYSSKYGSYYLGQDFPFLLGLMYDFTGDINGGGVEIGIRTEQGNIYLRKSE